MSRSARSVQSLKTGAIAQLLPIVAGYGTVLISTPFVVGRLGLHDFGIWSMTGAIAQYAALFDMGVSRAANRNVALFHAKGDVKSEGAVVGICISVLLLLGSVLIALSLALPSFVERVLRTENLELTRLLILCATLITITGLIARVFAAASIGRGRQVHANIGLAILSTLQALGGVAALVISPSLEAFAIGTAAGTFAGLAAVIIMILSDEKRLIMGLPNLALARDILTFGINSQIAAAGAIMLLQSGKLIAGIMLGPAAAGVYELASRLAMGAQVLGAAIPGALMPHLTRSHIADGWVGVLDQYEYLTRRNAAVALFAPFAMAATAFSGIPLWLGTSKEQVIYVLLALLPGIATNVSTGVCTSLLSAINRTGILAQVAVVGGVAQVAFAVALGYSKGFIGLAIAFGIGVPLVNLASMWYMHSRAKIPMAMFFRGVSGPFGLAVTAFLLSFPIGILAAPDSRASPSGRFAGPRSYSWRSTPRSAGGATFYRKPLGRLGDML